MTKYKKTIDGKVVIKERKNIILKIDKNGQKMQIINPTEDMLLADGWVEYVIPEPTAEELLARAKANKVREIEAYDKSSAVNSFYYGNVEFWLDRDTRVSVRSTAEIMKEMGKQTMTLWLGDVNVTLAPEQVLQMLAVLEIYALECYNMTAEHKSAVNNLATIEEVEAYDFRCGYPEKIHF